MAKKRINGRTATQYVQTRTEFKNSNGQLYGEWKHLVGRSHYTVYSYGVHWPLFIYDLEHKLWFENSSKYSPTTSKHRSYAHPHCDTKSLTVDQMRQLDAQGYHEFALARLTDE